MRHMMGGKTSTVFWIDAFCEVSGMVGSRRNGVLSMLTAVFTILEIGFTENSRQCF